MRRLRLRINLKEVVEPSNIKLAALVDITTFSMPDHHATTSKYQEHFPYTTNVPSNMKISEKPGLYCRFDHQHKHCDTTRN